MVAFVYVFVLEYVVAFVYIMYTSSCVLCYVYIIHKKIIVYVCVGVSVYVFDNDI